MDNADIETYVILQDDLVRYAMPGSDTKPAAKKINPDSPTRPLHLLPATSVERTKLQMPMPARPKPLINLREEYIQMLGDRAVRNPETEIMKHESSNVLFRPRDVSARGPKKPEPMIHPTKKSEAGMPALNLSWHMRPHSETTDDPLPSTHSHRLPSISHKEDSAVHHRCLLINGKTFGVMLFVKSGV